MVVSLWLFYYFAQRTHCVRWLLRRELGRRGEGRRKRRKGEEEEWEEGGSRVEMTMHLYSRCHTNLRS